MEEECNEKYPCVNPTDNLLEWTKTLTDKQVKILKEALATTSCFKFSTVFIIVAGYILLLIYMRHESTNITIAFIALILTYIISSIVFCD